MIAIGAAKPSDEAAIRELLRTADLPTEDLGSDSFDRFIVARSDRIVVGAAGFEVCETLALARSLAVLPFYRNQGIASTLLDEVERMAASEGASTMYGLTMTIEAFLDKRGYERLVRAEATDEIRRTTEFTRLFPESAVLMRKPLN